MRERVVRGWEGEGGGVVVREWEGGGEGEREGEREGEEGEGRRQGVQHI